MLPGDPADLKGVLARRWKLAIIAAAAFAFLCKLLLAFRTYGTNDVYAWERFAHWSQLFGVQLYRIDAAFNHPPSMIHVLRAMTWLANTTGIFFPFWLRLPAILADVGSLYVISRIFAARLHEPAVRWSLLLLAISPVVILVSGYHGNTDSVVIFFLLVSVWKSEEPSSDWAAGAVFGAAMCVKIFPLIVAPAYFFYRPGLTRRVKFVAAACAVPAIFWTPFLYQDPQAIVHQVIGYPSIYGHWGLPWLAYHLSFFRDSWHEAFQRDGAYVILGIIAIAAFFINRRATRPPLYTQVGAAFFFFLAVTNGFGVQYLAWLAPWTLSAGLLAAGFFHLASGTFLFLCYNYWAGGFPWYLSDSNYVGDFSGHIDYSLTMSWLSVIFLAIAVWQKRQFPGRSLRWTMAILAIPFVIYPAWQQLREDARRYAPSIDHAAVTSIHSGEHAMLSEQYFRLGRYQDAVVAARTGVALDPGQLDAWNRLAQACIRLGRWEEATNAATNAIQLAPDDQMAIANIAALRSR